MALTRQQFDELRAKGLTVDQIIKFESGQVPVTTQAKPNFFQGVGQKLQARGKEFASEIGKAGKGELASTSLGTIARATTRAGSLVGGGLGDILVEGVKAVLPQKTEEKIKSGISNIASQPIPQKVIQSVSSWAEKNPEAAKDLEGALEIAGLIPLTKGIQVGGKAVIQTGKEIAGDISKVAGKTLATTGAVTEKAGKSLVSASFPPTKSQAKAILSYKSKTPLLKRVELAAKSAEKAPITPSEVALKYNLIGVSRSEIGAKAKRVANQLFENQVNPVISGIEKKVNVKDLFNTVKKTIDKTADTSKRKSLINAFNSLKDDYKNVSTLSYKKLDQIKSEMSKGLPAKVWQGQDIAGELNNVRKMFSDKAREVIRKELPDNVKRVYDEYGSLVSIMEKGEKSLQRGLDIGVLGLTSEAIRRGATPITTIGGKAINKAGEIIKGVGQRLQKGGTKLKSQGEKGSLLNIKPGLTIEDVSLKGKGETLKSNPKNFKTAEDYVKAHSLYHGTPAKLEGNKLSFGKGGIKKGGQSGGLFLTDNPNSAKTFAFGGEVYQATPEIKNQVIDLTKKEGVNKFKSFIGKSYKDFDGELIKFDKQSFDSMFPNGKADFATVSQFPELVEKIVKDNKLKGIAFNEFAGGEVGKTYQILSGDIPVKTKSQLISEWNKAQKLKSNPLIQEAKKYKSADEFIKAQGTPVYHGTSKQFDKFDTTKISEGNLGKGIYLTDNQTAAKYHSLLADRKQLVKEVNPKTLKYRDEKLGEIMDINISQDAKIKEFSKMPTREMVNKARQEGFDGVKYPDTLYKTAEDWNAKLLGEMKETPNTTLLFNSDKIKTKYQLTDIWNKAQKLKSKK